MRLFVSINLPESFNVIFRELQNELNMLGKLKHAGRKSGFHLTLFFLGEVDVSRAMEIAKALQNIHCDCFSLKMAKRLGCFIDNGFVKNVFVGIDDACDGYQKLIELQKQVTYIVGKFGFKDVRKFSPHITLSRVGSVEIGFEDKIKDIDVVTEEFSVESICLMESNLMDGGSEYSEIAVIDLAL